MVQKFYVYILTNKSNTTLYIGITNDIVRRVNEHNIKLPKKFTSRYNVTKLVYLETYTDALDAIRREKQIKNYSRQRKFELITELNPNFDDLLNAD